MGWSLVQNASLSNASTITPTVSVTNAIGSGNLYCGGVIYDSAQTLNSVTDDKSNTYNLSTVLTDSTNALSTRAFWLGNITNGPKTITFHFSAATQSCAVVSEFSGDLSAGDPNDGSVGNHQVGVAAGANNQTSTAITTTTAGDLIFGIGCDNNSGTTAPTAGTSPNAFTSIGTANNTTNTTSIRTEYFSQVSAGSIAATFGIGTANDDSNTIVVAFKPLASASLVASWYSPFEEAKRLRQPPIGFQEPPRNLVTSAPLSNHFPGFFDPVPLQRRPAGFVDHEHNIATQATPSYPGALFDPPPHLKVPPGFVDLEISTPKASVPIQEPSFVSAKPLKPQAGFIELPTNIATQAPLINHFPALFDFVPLQKRPAGFDDRPWPIVPTPPQRTENFFPVLRLKQNIEFQQQYQNPTISAPTPPVFALSPNFDPSVKLRTPDSSLLYTPQIIIQVAASGLKITDTTHLQLPINAILMGQQDYEEGHTEIEANDPNYRTRVKVSFGGGGKLSSNDPGFTTKTSKKGYD